MGFKNFALKNFQIYSKNLTRKKKPISRGIDLFLSLKHRNACYFPFEAVLSSGFSQHSLFSRVSYHIFTKLISNNEHDEDRILVRLRLSSWLLSCIHFFRHPVSQNIWIWTPQKPSRMRNPLKKILHKDSSSSLFFLIQFQRLCVN